MPNPLKVILLDAARGLEGRAVFYAEPPDEGEGDGAEGPPPVGIRARVEDRLRKVKTRWRTSEGRTRGWAGRVWDWLHSRTHPDEVLLARLRSAPAIDLHHPTSLGAEEVGAAWSAFLVRSRRRHWPWFVLNALVAPATALLAVLPGPNLVGYWFAYRALHHGLILWGLGRVRSGRVETRLRPTPLLDRPAGGDDGPARGTSHLAALGCDPGAVAAFLHRLGRRRGIRPGAAEAGRPA